MSDVCSGVEEGTAVEIAAVAMGTLTMVGGELAPDVIGYLIRPMVAITVPLPGPVTGQHVFKIGPGAGFFLAGRHRYFILNFLSKHLLLL